MCVIAFAWNAHPHWRLVLAGNRDEFHARPSATLARWPDAPILAGRDLQAGGTWLGVSGSGRCSVVTNVRNPRDPQEGLSRGLLVTDYLAGTVGAAAHAASLRARAAGYRPFNLLLFDAAAGIHVGNRPGVRASLLAPGVHGLSNADLDTPWPKTQRLIEHLQRWLAMDAADFAPLFDALADERIALDAQLPDTGVGLERERWLSATFIHGASYGTRASTVVAIDHHGCGEIIERGFAADGMALGETRLRFGS